MNEWMDGERHGATCVLVCRLVGVGGLIGVGKEPAVRLCVCCTVLGDGEGGGGGRCDCVFAWFSLRLSGGLPACLPPFKEDNGAPGTAAMDGWMESVVSRLFGGCGGRCGWFGRSRGCFSDSGPFQPFD